MKDTHNYSKKKILIFVGILLGLLSAVVGFLYFSLSGISQSHIDGNVPDGDVFNTYLSRDLEAYFHENGITDTNIMYRLLDQNPNQYGLSYPKYYLLVTNSDIRTGEIIDQGIAVVSAQEREYFVVINYISLKEIHIHSETMKIFPSHIAEKISQELNSGSMLP